MPVRRPPAGAPGLALSVALGCALGVALGGVPAAQALHFDIEVRTSGGPVAGSQLGAAIGGDATVLGPALPVDVYTGALIFPADFADFEGGPCTTANPGFQATAGQLLANEELHFRGTGSLVYWDPTTQAWGTAPGGVEVVLFGAIPPDVLQAYITDPTAAAATYSYWEHGTRFSAAGVSGPLAAGVARASSAGALHTHLDWMISTRSNSTPASGCDSGAPAGVYMLSLVLWSPAESDGSPKYAASAPLQVAFAHGVSEAQFIAAVRARTVAAPPPAPAPPVPPPPPPAPPAPPAATVTLPASLTPWGPPRRLPWDNTR